MFDAEPVRIGGRGVPYKPAVHREEKKSNPEPLGKKEGLTGERE